RNVEWATAQEFFDFGETERNRGDAGNCQAYVFECLAGGVEFDQRGKTNQRDHERAAMSDLLQARAVTRKCVAFDREQDLARRKCGLTRPDDELVERQLAPQNLSVVRRRKFNARLMCHQAGCTVGGGGGVDNITADRRKCANLIVGKPYG